MIGCSAFFGKCPNQRVFGAGRGHTPHYAASVQACVFKVVNRPGAAKDLDFGDDDIRANQSIFLDIFDDTAARTIHYHYDLGDGWNHVIEQERVLDAVPMASHPTLLAAEGRWPPEGVGGPPGYQDFLEIFAYPDHEEHAQTLTWCGGAFDPRRPDIDRILAELDKLARRWAPRPRRAPAKRTAR